MIPRFQTLLVILAIVCFAPRLSAQNLNLYLTSDSDLVAPSDRVTVTSLVTNTGTVNLTDVSVLVQRPESITGFVVLGDGVSCFGNGTCIWTVGTLAPGDSRQVGLFTSVRSDAPQGDILRTMMLGRSSTGGEVSAAQDVQIDPTPLLRLSLAPDPGPAAPGEPFTYTLTFGNVGSSSPSSVVLRMPVPEGTSFASATCGAIITEEAVLWELGSMAVGGGGQLALTVTPDAASRPVAC